MDDDLPAQASKAMGATERSVLLHEGLKLIVQREVAGSVAALGGSARPICAFRRAAGRVGVAGRRGQ